jgi:hypothetical protein
VENNMPDAMSLEGFNLIPGTAFFCASALNNRLICLSKAAASLKTPLKAVSIILDVLWAFGATPEAPGAPGAGPFPMLPMKNPLNVPIHANFIHVGENGLGRLHTTSGKPGHGAVLLVSFGAEGLFYKRHQIFIVDLSYIVRGSLANIGVGLDIAAVHHYNHGNSFPGCNQSIHDVTYMTLV